VDIHVHHKDREMRL
jgi:hypothetical protein